MGSGSEQLELQTSRLRLRCWTPEDADDFARLNRELEVMRDLVGPLDRGSSDAKLARYIDCFETHGYSRWAVETLGDPPVGRFIGYVGVVARDTEDHPLGNHDEIGWRLTRSAWGKGYATEAGCAALQDVRDRVGLTEVLAYTSPANARSQAVMGRVGLHRDPSLDFTVHAPEVGAWRGLVWRTEPR